MMAIESGCTLNGSALALPRIIAGVLENHQSKNGIRILKLWLPILALIQFTNCSYAYSQYHL